MWLKGVAAQVKTSLQELNDKVAPVARVIAEAGPVLIELRGATTPIGIITAAATAVNASNAWLSENRSDEGPVGTVIFPWSEALTPALSDIISEMASEEWDTDHGFRRWALDKDFAGMVCQSIPGEPEAIRVYRCSETNHRRLVAGAVTEDDVKRLRISLQARFREVYPARILEAALDSDSPERSRIKASEIAPLGSPRGEEILNDTSPLIPDHGEGRCILLTGKPGCGKTSMAAWIADAISDPIDRILHLRIDLIDMDDYVTEMVLKVLEPRVVILDDIDKLEDGLPNRVLEVIRRHVKLVILTANNGLDERVIDGSLIRPGRIDETFLIDKIGVELIPDGVLTQLAPEEWERVKTWPASFRTELVKRINGRGPERLNLEEMEHRIGMTVHSAGRMLEDD